MKRPRYRFAGVFFAHDYVIWALANSDGKDRMWPNVEFDFNTDLLQSGKEEVADRFISSGNPKEDIRASLDMLTEHCDLSALEAITIATIGPFKDGIIHESVIAQKLSGQRANPASIAHGTRLKAWAGFPVEDFFQECIEQKVSEGVRPRCFVLKDAEAFVLGEHYKYRHSGLPNASENLPNTVLYLLVDQTISSAVLFRNKPFRGGTSPEFGRMPIYRHRDDKDFKKPLPFSYPSLEDLASLSALSSRWGITAEDIPRLNPSDLVLELIAYYLAQTLAQAAMTFAPTTMIIGGRVANNEALASYVRHWYRDMLQIRGSEAGNLFPDYYAQRHFDEHIKLWTSPDCGVLGCVSWSQMRIDGNIIRDAKWPPDRA